MPIRNVESEDYEELVELYKSFFNTHNKFQKPNDEVRIYLKEQSLKNELLVYERNNALKGALCLINFGENADGSHKLWKFRHFAFTTKQAATQLLTNAEKKVQKSSKTSKIELHISETEKAIKFYKSQGYKQEGALLNHYNVGETCLILSKFFQ
jgi:hypothetical protein